MLTQKSDYTYASSCKSNTKLNCASVTGQTVPFTQARTVFWSWPWCPKMSSSINWCQKGSCKGVLRKVVLFWRQQFAHSHYIWCDYRCILQAFEEALCVLQAGNMYLRSNLLRSCSVNVWSGTCNLQHWWPRQRNCSQLMTKLQCLQTDYSVQSQSPGRHDAQPCGHCKDTHCCFFPLLQRVTAINTKPYQAMHCHTYVCTIHACDNIYQNPNST